MHEIRSFIVSTIRYIDSMATSAGGTLLREARTRAGLTQQQLASRADVTQSVISAYESGHRQPALSTLAALVDAAGFDLDVRVRRRRRGLERLSGPLGRRVRRHRSDIVAVAAKHGITNVHVFGSVARGQDRPDSDIDLMADVPTNLGLIGLGRVIEELEGLLQAPIDLLPAASLKPKVAARATADAVPL
jgi:predicted nucleotidyltransferase/DNA-binding XRE family transcriptional regulator